MDQTRSVGAAEEDGGEVGERGEQRVAKEREPGSAEKAKIEI